MPFSLSVNNGHVSGRKRPDDYHTMKSLAFMGMRSGDGNTFYAVSQARLEPDDSKSTLALGERRE